VAAGGWRMWWHRAREGGRGGVGAKSLPRCSAIVPHPAGAREDAVAQAQLLRLWDL